MRKNAAFTLIEMSIVLVIIGLLIAAIVGGKSLLETSKLNAVISDITKFRSAYFKFKEIYNAKPGDMIDATNQWPNESVNANGDGDSKIGNAVSAGCAECLWAWTHLQYAGLIDGKFDGTTTSVNAMADVNVPSTPLGKGSVYFLLSLDSNILALMIAKPTSGGIIAMPALTGPEAAAIDQKIDDGRSASGKIYGIDTFGDDLGMSVLQCHDGINYVTNDNVVCDIWYYLDTTN